MSAVTLEFENWKNSDNVICTEAGKYRTQCTQYARFFTYTELFNYYLSDYAEGLFNREEILEARESICTDKDAQHSNRPTKLGLSKREIRNLFRKGNRLVALSVTDEMNPMGCVGHHLSAFRRWNEDLPYAIYDYFEDLYRSEMGIAWANYTRPVMRGANGELYSAQDMDNAMMYGG